MTAPLATVHGEPALLLATPTVRAALTPRGGMVAPVEFTLPSGRRVQPYSLAPWTPAEPGDAPPLLQVLRGDFFCFPFGETPGVPEPHGPTANATWEIVATTAASAHLQLRANAPRATIDKHVSLRPGHAILYQEHRVATHGRYNYGHHPILHVPPGVTAEVRTSAFRFGGIYPGPASRPPGEHSVLQAGARFPSLTAVPLAAGGTTSLARYPARPGTEDIVMLAGFAAAHAWTALTFDGYVWFSLRRATDFPGTLFWMSDAGRSFPPWNSRHDRRIGIEDVCSHYCDGAHISAADRLAAEGIVTARTFTPGEPVRLPHVQGVAEVPAGFGGLAALEPDPAQPRDTALLRGESGAVVRCPLDWTFLDP